MYLLISWRLLLSAYSSNIPCFFFFTPKPCLKTWRSWAGILNTCWGGEKQFLHEKVQISREAPQGTSRKGKNFFVKWEDGWRAEGLVYITFTKVWNYFCSNSFLLLVHLNVAFQNFWARDYAAGWKAHRKDPEWNEEWGQGPRKMFCLTEKREGITHCLIGSYCTALEYCSGSKPLWANIF